METNKPVTVNVEMEVMPPHDISVMPFSKFTQRNIKKSKTVYVDNASQRLVNLNISIKALENKIVKDKETLKDYKAKVRKLTKLMDQMDNI